MPYVFANPQILPTGDSPSYDACPSFEGGQVSSVQPKLLQANQAALLQNMDISEFAVAQTRVGSTSLGGAAISAGNKIQGLKWFFPPTLSLVIACVNGALQKWDGNSWTALAGYTPANISVSVEMAQGLNKLFITDGIGDLFSWDGGTWYDLGVNGIIAISSHAVTSNVATITTTSSISNLLGTGTLVTITGSNNAIFDVTNQVITVTGSNTFTFPLVSADIATTADASAVIQNNYSAPIAPYIFWFTNRLFSYGNPTQPTQINASNILDATTWNQGLNSFNVGSGDGDPIVACVPWTDTVFVCFKRNSIYAVDADPTVATATWNIGTIHRKIGCVAHRSAVQVGADIWFLAHDGIRSVQRIQTQDQNEVTFPISLPIQDIIERINWPQAGNACAVFWNNRYILSVPVDSSTSNNYTIVYNTLTKSWSGYWTGWTPTIFELTFFTSQGGRMIFGTSDGRVPAWLDYIPSGSLVDANFTDDGVAITSQVTTRSMTFQEPFNPKKILHFEMEFIQSDATATAQMIPDLGSAITLTSFPSFGASVNLPVNLPFNLIQAGTYKKAIPLMGQQPFREVQFNVTATSGNLSLRTILADAYINTIVLQT